MIPVLEIFGEALPMGSALVSLASVLVVGHASRCSAENERESADRTRRESRASRVHRLADSQAARPSR